MEDKIIELLNEIRPYLNNDGGDLEFIRYEDNYVYVKLVGACATCGFKDETINYSLECYLKDQIPEIKGVINVSL